jgi:hypothetical protein
MRCRTLILAAMLPEARAIARAFRLPSRFANATTFSSSGDLAVALVGVGAPRLPSVASEVQPQSIIMAGVAGGLDPRLKAGDVLISPFLPKLNLPPLPCSISAGTIHTASAIIASASAKKQLFQTTHAAAVDMETSTAATFAKQQQIPFLAVRGISDTADQALPPALLTLIDADGRPRPARALALLLGHPSLLLAMLHLKHATDRAMQHVVAVLRAIVASDWPKTPTDIPETLPESARL